MNMLYFNYRYLQNLTIIDFITIFAAIVLYIWFIPDIIMILIGKFKDKNGKLVKKWFD